MHFFFKWRFELRRQWIWSVLTWRTPSSPSPCRCFSPLSLWFLIFCFKIFLFVHESSAHPAERPLPAALPGSRPAGLADCCCPALRIPADQSASRCHIVFSRCVRPPSHDGIEQHEGMIYQLLREISVYTSARFPLGFTPLFHSWIHSRHERLVQNAASPFRSVW